MNGIIFDLKNFRAKHLNGMSQEEFARRIGISQDKVSRIEANPGQVPLEILITISKYFGIKLDDLIEIDEPKSNKPPMSLDYTWASAEYIRRTIINYIEKNDVGNEYKAETEELKDLVNKTIRKPKVAFIGRSDVGKSTMINSFLGTDQMPAHWTPTTAIAVYIKHVNDRPAYMDEDVWVFKNDEDSDEVWDDSRLEDEAYCRSLRVSSGNFDLLNTYGTRRGGKLEESKATAAVVFIDSNLLLNCDIIDLPGYGTGDRVEDDIFSLREKSKADVLVYLSIANGFMRSEDISYIKEAIPSLTDIQSCGEEEMEPLANLFIVASQAHIIDDGNFKEIQNILDDGCERFERSLTENFWNNRRKPDALVKRFYSYTSNSPALCERLERDFCRLIEELSRVVEQKAKIVITEWVKNKDAMLQDVIAGYQQLLDDRKKWEEALKEYERLEPQRHASFQNRRHKILENIKKYNRECQDKFSKSYSEIISEDNLVSLMEERDIKKKKEDLQIFSAYISDLLQNEVNNIINEKTQQLKMDIDEFLNEFETNSSIPTEERNIKILPFCKEQAFAAGLAGVATYGALALWAASCGNLGGYILIAKGVSLLSSIGISVGGVSAAVSAVSAIGGPVVLGIALALIAAVTAFAAFSGSWKKSVAKKIVKSCQNEKILEKILSDINTYWMDTQLAFCASADNLEAEWKKYLERLREQLQNYDVDTIISVKNEAEKMRNFLRSIPIIMLE